MAWIGAAISAVGSIASSSSQSKAGKKAGKKARKGSQEQLQFMREAMNMARADTRHSRQAGATALNALMSMTGLSGGGGGGARYDENGWPISSEGGGALADPNAQQAEPIPLDDPSFRGGVAGRFGSGYDQGGGFGGRWAGPQQLRYNGGPMYPDTIYNVNEMGPENRFQGGSVYRNSQPITVGGEDGYVQPNIEGRASGGFNKKAFSSVFTDPGLAGISHQMGFYDKKPRRGQLPGTDWVRNSRGRIAKTGYGHWNNDLNAYVDRRGGVKKHQAAPPEGWEDPSKQTDIDTTQGTDFNFKTDPGYQFRFEEGQRALERGAAMRGGLLSGGYARKAIRYGQGFASNEYTNVYNRIANIAGMGQTANQQAGGYAMMGGQGMGNAAAASGMNSAYGAQASGNAIAGGIDSLAGIDWGSIFNRNATATSNPNQAIPRPRG